MIESGWNVHQRLALGIKRERVAQGWSQQVLAERLGCARAVVSDIECCKRRVHADELLVLCELFEVPLGSLVFGRDEASGAVRAAMGLTSWE